ncbi:MAG TPA: RDD family protein [Nocardioidaceae bacterium]|nr:RDD family protein [Nocardioidaceae bacterium]
MTEAPDTARRVHEESRRREARDFQGQPAGVVSRTVAAFVDGIMVIGIVVAGWLGWSGVAFIAHPRNYELPSPAPLLATGVYLAVAFVYLTFGWSTSGRTLGSQVMGLRVVGRRGRRLPWARAAARAAICVVFPAGLFWSAVSASHDALQDILIRTRVIYDWTHRTPPAED